MIKTKDKKKFLKSEHKHWEYWKDFSYAEYLRDNSEDAIKCKCGVYHWEGLKKPCDCDPQQKTD